MTIITFPRQPGSPIPPGPARLGDAWPVPVTPTSIAHDRRVTELGRAHDVLACPMSPEAEAAFLAEVEVIKSDCRARRARYRHAWNAATRALSNVEADYSRQYDGVNFFEGGE
jgi:hypothetical protein